MRFFCTWKTQVKFSIEVTAGPSFKEIALETVINLQATWVILDRWGKLSLPLKYKDKKTTAKIEELIVIFRLRYKFEHPVQQCYIIQINKIETICTSFSALFSSVSICWRKNWKGMLFQCQLLINGKDCDIQVNQPCLFLWNSTV